MQQQPKAEYSVVQDAPQVSPQEQERAVHNQAAQADENIEPINTGTPDYTIGEPSQQHVTTGEEVSAPPTEDGLVRVLDETKPDESTPQQTTYKSPELGKLDEFIQDTGGSLEDYLNLNKDYDTIDEDKILTDYYKATKPGYSEEEIELHKESVFGDITEYGDEDSREYKMAKLKKKEALLEAKAFLNTQKDKYYQDLKNSNGNRVQGEEQQRQQQEQFNHFSEQTNGVFSEDFNGFVFETDGGKFQYAINDVSSVKDFQSDINNFFGEHLDEKGYVKDAAKYHKALWASQNADKIAKFFYNQGQADAVTNAAKEAKNISTQPQKHPSNPGQSKAPFRVVDNPTNPNRQVIPGRFNQ